MEKLKLSLEDLVVTSFETDSASEDEVADGCAVISGAHFTCKTCLTNITCCTPLA